MRLYGLSEIAEELEVAPGTVRQWRVRGKLPAPDAVLASGPVWRASSIRPFIRRTLRERRPKPS